VRAMPPVRLIGNVGLSFISKLSSGYWDVFDPTNGYVAIHRNVLLALPHAKIARRYFFESDMLFRLNLLRAVVLDVPMHAVYGEEGSSLKVVRELFNFFFRHSLNIGKRLFYSYFLRDFSIASAYLLLSIPLIAFGAGFGGAEWIRLSQQGITASAGTVMLAGLPIILGVQLLLGFLAFDMSNLPRRPVAKRLRFIPLPRDPAASPS